MSITEKIKSYFIDQAANTPRAIVSPEIKLVAPDGDDDEIVPQQDKIPVEGEDLGYAEGQSFIIEYVDAKGGESRRDITVWHIGRGTGDRLLLVARCHMRKQTRHFRIDRIKTVIDHDGEIHDNPAKFLIETFGMPDVITRKALSNGPDPSQAKLNRIRKIIRGQANVLAALSRADGYMHPAEIGVMLDYCADKCAKEGVFLEDAEMKIIREYLRRMRPDQHVVLRFLDETLNASPKEINSFLCACNRLVLADNVLRDEETRMINEFSVELTGIKII